MVVLIVAVAVAVAVVVVVAVAVAAVVTVIISAAVELQKYFIISDSHYIKHLRHSLRVLHYQHVCEC
jgi:hypothetical protein